MKPLLLFDLDGTIIDSLDDIHSALKKTTDTFELPTLDRSTVQRYVGPGIEELLNHAIQGSNVTLETCRLAFKNFYRQTHVHTTLYEGIPTLLNTLKNNNHALCVLTNKPEEPAKELLAFFKIAHLFDHIIGPDTYGFCKPHPGSIFMLMNLYKKSPEDIMMIGDGDPDILAAKAAGIKSIAVTYGYRTKEKLAGLRPTYLVENVAELQDLLINNA